MTTQFHSGKEVEKVTSEWYGDTTCYNGLTGSSFLLYLLLADKALPHNQDLFQLNSRSKSSLENFNLKHKWDWVRKWPSPCTKLLDVFAVCKKYSRWAEGPQDWAMGQREGEEMVAKMPGLFHGSGGRFLPLPDDKSLWMWQYKDLPELPVTHIPSDRQWDEPWCQGSPAKPFSMTSQHTAGGTWPEQPQTWQHFAKKLVCLRRKAKLHTWAQPTQRMPSSSLVEASLTAHSRHGICPSM